ncbi:hypothetical protein ACFQU2_18635 [Siccirubricoccus deserti]
MSHDTDSLRPFTDTSRLTWRSAASVTPRSLASRGICCRTWAATFRMAPADRPRGTALPDRQA